MMPTLEELERGMPQLKGFAARYRKEAIPILERHELRRRKAEVWAAWAIFVGGAGMLLVLFTHSLVPFGGHLWKIVFFVTMILFAKSGMEFAAARKDTKVILAEMVCKMLGFTYIENPTRSHMRWFRDLALISHYDVLELEDEVSGVVDGISFHIQEAIMAAEKTTVSAQKHYDYFFHGLVGVIDFHKSFSSTTIVSAQRGLFQRMFKEGIPGERARLESPRFEERFDVFTTDQIEARYLLTPAFMERIMNLDRFFKGNLQFAFDKGRFLFTVNQQSEWMEPRGNLGSLVDESHAVLIVLDIILVHYLINALKLDAKTRA